jgi:hypothetical protein
MRLPSSTLLRVFFMGACVLALAACGDGSDEHSKASTVAGVVSDPVGDTADSITLTDPTDVTVDVDVKSVALDYDNRRLRVKVTYAEPLDPKPKAASLFVHVTSHSAFDDEVLKWYDGRRPWVVGEDGVRTRCRPPAADVDHAAGEVVLVVPAGSGCISDDDPPGKLEIAVTAWGDGAVDFVDAAVVTLS